MKWILEFGAIGLADVPRVGGKNASLGEMIRTLAPTGVRIPAGFALTAAAYREHLRRAGLEEFIARELSGRRRGDPEALARACERIRAAIVAAPLPGEIAAELRRGYAALGAGGQAVAVRSSATAEDLPNASFAGQQESYLNVRGAEALLAAVRRAYASLFTARAVSYREDLGFDHASVALSVGVQRMVRSDLASAGVLFTLDPESGHRGVVVVTSSWGLGESVVQGRVAPDQFWVHKAALRSGHRALFRKALGTKETRIVYEAAGEGIRTEAATPEARRRFSLDEDDVLQLAAWALRIEAHYSAEYGRDTPMDIEWAKDGETGELFVVQARPETVHAGARPVVHVYRLLEKGRVLATGSAVGDRIARGTTRILADPSGMAEFRDGEILVTEVTDPDWEPIMKRAAGIVTDRGGRTSHAAIVARELGIPAIVGAGDATRRVPAGQAATLSCADGETGRLYSGALRFQRDELDLGTLPRPRTKLLVNVGDPSRALGVGRLPCDGVGLARLEFVFSGWVGVHPMALLHPERLGEEDRRRIAQRIEGSPSGREYFVDRLSQGLGTLAAAFHPRPVILRFSDFKTNEYARLLGGAPFEPAEENPMLGWRGASRYAHPDYREGFLLEVAAVKRVRERFGLDNLHVMVPFCRTPEEGRRVLEVMRDGGLERHAGGLLVYVMAEIPSNILLAPQFAALFDGFSIGSNDLTQLTLGVDRDSARIAGLFDEGNDAVLWSFARLIRDAHAHGCTVGICGQAPSDRPEIAEFLVERGIDSISVTPDALVRTLRRVSEVERRLAEESPGVARERREPAHPG
jgi:pyruvate,water dikinase